MNAENFLTSLGLIVVAGAMIAFAAKLVKMPSIAAYLLAGLAIGPITGWVEVSHVVELISEVGIALLLFLVGLELSIGKIREVGRVALAAGIGQVAITAAIGFGLTLLLGFSLVESAFLATALTFSSTVVVVKLLDEKREMDSLYGRIAVGIGLVQNLVAIVMLTFLAGLGRDSGEGAGTVLIGILRAFGGMTLLLGAVLGAVRWALPRPFAWAARNPETSFLWSLGWCFLIVLAAQWLGLSLEIGAFLAGLSLAQLPSCRDIRIRLHPLMSFFISVFFVSLGIQMDLGAAMDSFWTMTLLSVFVLIMNPLIFLWIVSRMGYSERTSFYTGVAGAQISEFSFILVAMGVSSGGVAPEVLSLTTMIGLVTISISSYFILYNRALYDFCRRMGWLKIFRARQGEDRKPSPPGQAGHVIVVGMNTLGRELATRLSGEGVSVVAVDRDPSKLEGLACETLAGSTDYPAVLEEARLPCARLLVSALRIEDANDLLAYHCRREGVPYAATVMDLGAIDNLLAMDAAYLITPKVDGMLAARAELERLGILPA